LGEKLYLLRRREFGHASLAIGRRRRKDLAADSEIRTIRASGFFGQRQVECEFSERKTGHCSNLESL